MEQPNKTALFVTGAVLLGIGVFTFLPELSEAWYDWSTEPDYSHGFLVAPIAAFLLWERRDKLAGMRISPSAWGFLPLAGSMVLRFLGIYFYREPLNHLAFGLWVFSVFWIIGGWQFVRWALPGVVFLLFMFPFPWRLETSFSQPLQKIATAASCWILQLLGQPAFAMGNVITINGAREYKLEVVQACSGLRMVVGFLALCVAYAFLTRRPLWEKTLIILSSFPIAIACNVLRITITGLLSQHFSEELAHQFTHDFAGWMMMPVALVMLVGTLWYMDRLFVESEMAESTIGARPLR